MSGAGEDANPFDFSEEDYGPGRQVRSRGAARCRDTRNALALQVAPAAAPATAPGPSPGGMSSSLGDSLVSAPAGHDNDPFAEALGAAAPQAPRSISRSGRSSKGALTGYSRCACCSADCWRAYRQFLARQTTITILFVLVTASALGLFVLSAIQVGGVTKAGSCPPGDAVCKPGPPIHSNGTCATFATCDSSGKACSCDGACDASSVVPYRPFRFAYGALPSVVLSCGWPTANSWWRMGIAAASLLVLTSGILFTWKERTGYMVVTIILMLLTAVGHIMSSVLDANALRGGGTECSDGFKHVYNGGKIAVNCHMWPLEGCALWNFAHGLLWGQVTYAFLCFRNKLDSEVYGDPFAHHGSRL